MGLAGYENEEINGCSLGINDEWGDIRQDEWIERWLNEWKAGPGGWKSGSMAGSPLVWIVKFMGECMSD